MTRGMVNPSELLNMLSPKQRELFNAGTKEEQKKALEYLKLKNDLETNDAIVAPKKVSTSLEQEAKKFKSAEDFVKAKTRNFGLPTRDVADDVYRNVYKDEKPIMFEVSKLNPTETKGTRELLGAEKFSEKVAGKSIDAPIIITEKGTILDGHNRYYQALANGDKEIPVFLLKDKEAYQSQLTDLYNQAKGKK